VIGALVFGLGTQDHGRSEPMNGPSHSGCPRWFEDAPRRGSGRSIAVSLSGLTQVTVCRYLHAFGGGEVVHHPPLKTNLVSEGRRRQLHTVKSLARGFNRLLPYPHPKEEARFCGNEGSGGFYVWFLYRDGHKASLEVKPSGCPHAIAGKGGRLLFLPTHLTRRLAKMAPPYAAVH